eukprot:GFUD01042902.1.p1 GENE.GFUD01042902.1~~GFUD01042902.1.p1  ORF type:complete len:113 (-),score=8.89 GFUD01042902.1:11-349(-)
MPEPGSRDSAVNSSSSLPLTTFITFTLISTYYLQRKIISFMLIFTYLQGIIIITYLATQGGFFLKFGGVISTSRPYYYYIPTVELCTASSCSVYSVHLYTASQLLLYAFYCE